MAKNFDAIIIGTGQSGPSLAARMTREGMKTAIVERKLFGGTCVNVGCIPSKTLIRAAATLHHAKAASRFDGIEVRAGLADWRAVQAQKDELVGSISSPL